MCLPPRASQFHYFTKAVHKVWVWIQNFTEVNWIFSSWWLLGIEESALDLTTQVLYCTQIINEQFFYRAEPDLAMGGWRRKVRRIKASRCHKNSTVRQVNFHYPSPKKKWKQYTQEQMQRAIEMASFGWISACEAAESIMVFLLQHCMIELVAESLTMLTQGQWAKFSRGEDCCSIFEAPCQGGLWEDQKGGNGYSRRSGSW